MLKPHRGAMLVANGIKTGYQAPSGQYFFCKYLIATYPPMGLNQNNKKIFSATDISLRRGYGKVLITIPRNPFLSS